MRRTPLTTRRASGRVRRQFARPRIIFRGRAFCCCTYATGGHSPAVNRHQPTMHRKLNTVYRLALRQEIRDRLLLARHAKRHGLCVARLWHVEQAAAARRKLRNLPKP